MKASCAASKARTVGRFARRCSCRRIGRRNSHSLLRNPKALKRAFGQELETIFLVALARRTVGCCSRVFLKFISTLRNQYGQHWLEEPPSWDSRRCTLGTYCSSVLGLLWWNDKIQDWRRFLRTNSGATVSRRDFRVAAMQKISRGEDWRRLFKGPLSR